MQELVGQCFRLEQYEYAIIDVRKVRGETVVYVEPMGATGMGPQRAALRYADIQSRMEQAGPGAS